MPLTMIQSDFFLENISLLTNDKSMLKKLIKEYHYYIKRKKLRYEKLGTMQSFIEAMYNFDQFAIGRYGAFSQPLQKVHYFLEKLFGLGDSRPK